MAKLKSTQFKQLTDAAIRRLILDSDGSVKKAAEAYGVSLALFRQEMKKRKLRVRDVLISESGYRLGTTDKEEP